MDRILDKTKQFIFAKQTSIFSSTLLIALMIVIARLFGLLQYRMLTKFFTKEQLEIFLASFRMPDLIFEILITGALTTSFIPFFVKFEKNKEQQSIIISSVINVIVLTLFFIVILLMIFLPNLMSLITRGFSKEKTDTVIYFSRLLLIGQLPFLIFGNFLTGISQARKMFLLPAVAPILYNLAVISATFFFGPSLSLLAPILGVIGGASLFFFIQLPVLPFSSFRYRFVLERSKALWDFFRIAIPRVFTVVVAQIDTTIDLMLTTLLGGGAYTIFYFAQRLQLLPVSVIGIAFGQASLPYLTEIYQEKHVNDFKKIITDSILNVFFLTIPMASFFIFARTPLVRLVFGGEKFDWAGTVQTAMTLSYFSLSLPFHSIYYFLTRCFYAMFDSKTPFYISFTSVLVNTLLSVFFIVVLKMPVWALGLSFSISMVFNVCMLVTILYIKLKGFSVLFLVTETTKIAFATFISSYAVYNIQLLLDGLVFDTSRTINVFLLLTTSAFIYFLLYLFLTWIFDIKEIYLLTKMILKVKEYQRKIVEIYTGIS